MQVALLFIMRNYLFKIFLPAGLLALLAILGCSKSELATAVKPPDPHIAVINTNEVAAIDFRAKLKENREKQKSASDIDELIASIQTFQEEMGRVPSNLVELVEMKYIGEIPQPPKNRKYVYQSNRGQVVEVEASGRPVAEEKKDDRKSATFIGQ